VKTAKISVSEALGTTLSTREQATRLFSHIRDCSNRVIVDFSKVSYISRSFADQFYKDFLRLNRVIMIQTVNGNQVVCDMLNAVVKTQQKRADTKSYKIQAFSSKEDLKKFLLSVD
jgi:hypothetical protein